jgi:flagellar biosynthesis protein FlhG
MLHNPNGYDQASGLRYLSKEKPIRVIAVTAGKGGVGKSNISVNLAIATAKQGQRVLLLDADLALANVDVLLGLHPKYNLAQVIKGQCSLNDVILDGPCGIKIVPGTSGTKMMANLQATEHVGLIHAFSGLADQFDMLIIDTAAGIAENVMSFTRAAQEVIVVVCDEPTSITDAYALIKVMNKEYGIEKFHILCNMVRSDQEARELFAKLFRVTNHFLDTTLDYLGAVNYDEYLIKAVKKQKAVSDAYPSSKSARQIQKISQKILDWPSHTDIPNGINFFFERLVQQTQSVRSEV